VPVSAEDQAAIGKILASGNLALADAYGQEFLRQLPDDDYGRALNSHIAALIGLGDGTGGTGDTRFDAVANPHMEAFLAGCGPCRSADKFLLIKAWGLGFWSDIFHVLGALLLAEVTGRTPYVCWGGNSLFSPDPARNAFSLYYTAINPDALDAILAVPADEIFPVKWRTAGLAAENVGKWRALHRGGEGRLAGLYLLNRPERLVVSDFFIGVLDMLPWIPETHPWHGLPLDRVVRALAAKYLIPNQDISDAVARVTHGTLAGGDFVAVHVRGSDKAAEMKNLDEFNRSYEPPVRRELGHGRRIFLMTDSAGIEQEYRDRYGDHMVCLEALRTASETGLHYTLEGEARHRAGKEVVIDVLAALHCGRFIGNGRSNPSCMVDFLIEDPGAKTLLAENQNRSRFLRILSDEAPG
jgi:hypothetical protein